MHASVFRLLLCALCALVVAISGAALAEPSLWEAATQDPETAARTSRYVEAMRSGHELGMMAMAMSEEGKAELIPASQRIAAVNRAVQAFRDAAAIDDTAAEPHYYIAMLLLLSRINCPACPFDAKIANAAIGAIDRFESRSPLDPRLNGFLSSRAILHTHLSGTVTGVRARAHLESALADYQTLLDRFPDSDELVDGNMAETLMMLGKVDEAIDAYRVAVRSHPNTSNTLGLAVALDRDERGTEARTIIRDLGQGAIGDWEIQVAAGSTFYVPDGEVFYYRALIEDAFGAADDAIADYERFVQSGAHPQFAPRAAANRDALRAKR
jgi:tetratricopeptide (TPR) repeat protein